MLALKQMGGPVKALRIAKKAAARQGSGLHVLLTFFKRCYFAAAPLSAGAF